MDHPPPAAVYQLPEFNIFRDGPDQYRLVAIDGSRLELDAGGARFFLLLDRCPADLLLGRLEEHGLPAPAGGWIDELQEMGLLTLAPAGDDGAFDRDQALRNVEEIPRGALLLPELAITLDDCCPLSCTYCFRRRQAIRGRLSRPVVAAVLKDFQRLAGRTLNISGGEPASFPAEVEHCAALARDLGVRHISVNSSGSGLTSSILAIWQAAGVNCLNLSLDCPDPRINDRLLGRSGATAAALCALEDARRLGLAVHLNATLFPETLSSLDDFRPLLAGGGVRLRLNPYVPLGDHPPLSPHRVREAAAWVETAMAEGLPVYLPIDPDEEYTEGFLCAGGLTRATLENDGRLGGCQFLMHRHGPPGTVQEHGLLKLWCEGDFQDFRDETVHPRPRCRDCSLRPWCVASCLAMHDGLPGGVDDCPFDGERKENESH